MPSSAHLTRLVSYEYMNRQLVWGAFTVRDSKIRLFTNDSAQEFLMFSVPFFPPMPTLFTPSALIAPIKAFLAQPTSIDYTSIPVTSAAVRDDSKAPLAAPSGLLASLPTATCPICYLRFASAPVPLDTSTSYGSAINLPPIQTVSLKEVTDGESTEETRIFVPAETDCWGRCRWCYYCIGAELAKHRSGLDRRPRSPQLPEKLGEGTEKWTCLRCGGGVFRAWRVGVRTVSDQPNRKLEVSSL